MPQRTRAKKAAANVQREVAAAHSIIWEHPALFSTRVLGSKLWGKQVDIFESVLTHSRIAVKGCHASSKTYSMGDLAVWWCMKYEDGIVIVTAPTQSQAKHGVWKEIKRAAARAAREYNISEPGETEWKLRGAENCAFIRAAAAGGQGVKFQAPHSGHVLIIADEAPGIDAEIFEAIEGIRAGGHVVLILLGNPTVPTGKFYEAFSTHRDRWKTITIDGLDSPNLVGLTLCRFNGLGADCDGSKVEGDPFCGLPASAHLREMPLDEGGPLDDNAFPFLLRRRWMREALEDWGETNPRFEARARGRFPQQAEGALIPLAWLEAAKWREVRRTKHRLSAGVDVAEAGEDETVCYVHDHGHIVGPPITYQGSPVTPDARGAIVRGLEPYQHLMGTIRYDRNGVGAYFGPHLRDMGYSCVGVNVGTAATKKGFVIYRDQAFWEMREEFERGNIAGLEDEKTIAQLASIRYSIRSDGKIQVMSKKDMRKKGSKSPDRADGLMLAITRSAMQVREYDDVARTPAAYVEQPPIMERDLNL